MYRVQIKHDLYSEKYKEELRVWSSPELIDGVWTVEATCAGDYGWTLNEADEKYLFLEEPSNA